MFGVGIVGSSAIAGKHAAAVKNIVGLDLRTVCDINQIQGKDFAVEYGIGYCYDYNELLRDEKIHLIAICTPNWLHAPMAEAAMLAGKHVLVEKPLALGVQEARHLMELSRQKRVQLGVAYQLRLLHHIKAVKKILEGGSLGVVNHFLLSLRLNRNADYFRKSLWRGQRAKDGGLLYNQAIHYLDLIHWFQGPFQVLTSYMTTRKPYMETEDLVIALLANKEGTAGIVEASISIYPQSMGCTLSIFAEKGTVILDGMALDRVSYWKASVPAPLSEDSSRGHEKLYDDFYRNLVRGSVPAVSGADVLGSMELIEKIILSSLTEKKQANSEMRKETAENDAGFN